MEFDWKEVGIILIAAIILGLTFSIPANFAGMKDYQEVFSLILYFALILFVSILAKKLLAYILEADVKTKFWELYQFGFPKSSHFKKPIPMMWLPIILVFLTRGFFKWMPILEFDITPRTERVARKHGLYRFAEMTEWHMGLISAVGIYSLLVLSIISYILTMLYPPLEILSKLSVYYACWSLLPISSLDGTKIFFGSRYLYFATVVISLIFLGFTFNFIF